MSDSTLLTRLQTHYNQMAPHVQKRVTAVLLKEAIEELEKLTCESSIIDDNSKIYPCDDCGKLRSKNEGGTTFTVCDHCWDNHLGGVICT